MIVRLIAIPPDGSRHELNVEGAIQYNINGISVDEPGQNRGSFSNQFKVPFSKANNKFFEYYYDVNVESDTFDHTKETDVEVYQGHELVYTGHLQLVSVNIFRKSYECVILNDSTSLFSQIRSMRWRELFTEDGSASIELDHALTASNIVSSWDVSNDITSGQVGAGTIVYALTDNAEISYGPGSWFCDTETELVYLQGLAQPQFAHANMMRPAVKVKYLIQKIFQKTGYFWDSEWLNSAEVSNLYMLLATEFDKTQTRPAYGAEVRLNTSLVIDYTSSDYVLLPFTNEVQDPDGVFAGGVFIAPYAGTFQLEYRLFGAGTAGDVYLIGAQVNSTGPVYTSQTAQVYANTTAAQIRYITLQLNAGDEVTSYVKLYGTSDWTLETASRVSLSLYQSSSGFVDVVANFPDSTVDEWLRGIAAYFNLVIVQDTGKPRNVIIETMDDFLAKSVTPKDWTTKVDLDKDIVVRPTTQEQSRQVIFTDKEGKDNRNAYWQFAFNKVKGRHVYENDNVHAQGVKTIGEYFAPLRVSNVNNFAGEFTYLPDLFVIELYSKRSGEARPQTGPPMLMYYHGLKPVGGTIYIDATAISQYGFWSHLQATTGTPQSLRWGHDYPDHIEHSLFPFTTKHLFREYYARHMQRLYDRQARTLYCRAYLNASDIRNFNLYDQVWVYNAYYRVVAIQGYTLGKHEAVQLQLIKDLEVRKWDCNLAPNLFNDDGTISFVDNKTGLPAASTEACCLAYGYDWNPANNSCYWSGGSDSGGEPPVTPWGNDGTSPTNVTPGEPPVPPTSDPNTGLGFSGETQVLFGETISNETVTLTNASNVSQLPVVKGNSTFGTIEIVGKTLDGSANLTSQLSMYNYDSESNVMQAISVDRIGNQGSILVRSLAADTISVDVVGVNGVPMAWMAKVNMMTFNTDYHKLPDVGDVHGDDSVFNGATDLYIEFNGQKADMTWNG